mmetsp:Transcript_5332/g.7518  ORF Transcript_5332/g.7518 Transcript_5332/m.7518 type:complete len:88 (-) Transcript_5332:87-350(-)
MFSTLSLQICSESIKMLFNSSGLMDCELALFELLNISWFCPSSKVELTKSSTSVSCPRIVDYRYRGMYYFLVGSQNRAMNGNVQSGW